MSALKKCTLALGIMLGLLLPGAFPNQMDHGNAVSPSDYDTVYAAETPCNHDWSDWYVTADPTVNEPGTEERNCYLCGETEEKEIPALEPYASFDSKSYTIKKGKTKKLSVEYAKGDQIKSWKSSKSSVVSVNSKGKIKGKKTGTAKITVTMKSGAKATCKVKVKKAASSKKSKSKSGKKSTAKKSGKSGGGTVYWTPSGSVYHKSRNCRTLKRSRTIHKGSISQSGKRRACKVCG